MGLSYQSCGCVSKLRLNTGLSHMLTLTHPLSHTQRGFMRRARTPLSACLQSTTDSVRIQERVSRNGSESESEGGERIFRRVCVCYAVILSVTGIFASSHTHSISLTARKFITSFSSRCFISSPSYGLQLPPL